jgi:hypothetical protein
LVALVALTYPAWGRQRYALGWLWVNLVAMLAASFAMDLGALDRGNASIVMMMIDLTAGVALAMRAGLPRVIAAGYALTIPLYVPMISGFFTRMAEPFTIIYAVSVAQILVFGLGSLGGNGGGGGRRPHSHKVSMAIPQRGAAMAGGPISAVACNGQE